MSERAIRLNKVHHQDLIRDEHAATMLLLCNMVCRILSISPGITQDEMFTRIADYVNTHTREKRFPIQEFSEIEADGSEKTCVTDDGTFLKDSWSTF